ncbi:hypothetical protein D9758_013857 [Tetrapyrgos nigripes]|uniref:Uncharacterized protein n=1 Tax=Tetrapyrgos nigripes TaxID=182062 RepID=A0A8H5FQM9_9AGAR|nr:hypothetical protein D9758_013857 [Tetrapyrgos nigripes]
MHNPTMSSSPIPSNHLPMQIFPNAYDFTMTGCSFQFVAGNVNNYSNGSNHAELFYEVKGPLRFRVWMSLFPSPPFLSVSADSCAFWSLQLYVSPTFLSAIADSCVFWSLQITPVSSGLCSFLWVPLFPGSPFLSVSADSCAFWSLQVSLQDDNNQDRFHEVTDSDNEPETSLEDSTMDLDSPKSSDGHMDVESSVMHPAATGNFQSKATADEPSSS